ncbi:MAG TPA: 50S ribosomal protein L25 [Patescibacteria group bacterium]|nr:50S ribosomal protein L25 [Patescibacteria group bacterium]
MKKYTLTGEKRELVGKKVKHLRREGKLPATIYGKKIKSASISISTDAFHKVYEEAGETGLVQLSVGGDTRPVLIHSVQVDPVSYVPLHVEFHQVDLKEKVHAKVSVELTGDSPAIAQKLGVLLSVLRDVEVEALPTDLPEKILVDISKLAEVNQELKVSDLSVASGVTVLTDGTLTIVKVGPLVTKEAEALAASEAAAAAEAAALKAEAATPTTEGQVPAAEGAPAKPEAAQNEEKKTTS